MRHLIATVLLVGFCVFAVAQPTPAPCNSPEHRQFDFWIGTWDVTDGQGNAQGINVITPAAGDCGLREEWTGAGGSQGQSLNYYDPADGRWHQHWVGQSGLLLHLTGGLADGDMVMSGERQDPQGTVIDRIAWSPLDDGRVRQAWSVSRDDGATWQLIFHGFYTRRD